MAVDAIGLVGTTAEAPRNAGIGQEDFLRILLAQLRFQDPLKPTDNQQFVAQLAQFSALEISRQQGENLELLASIQAADQAVGLIGRSVDVTTPTGSNLVGTVSAISFRTGEPLLTVNVNGTPLLDVKLSDVTLIR